jgi:hypothetical protein
MKLLLTTARSRGSPAYQFGLGHTMYITHLNGIATPGNTTTQPHLTFRSKRLS